MQRSKGPVKLAEISKRQQISLSYLEQLFTKLRQRKLVDSVRGPGGGYLSALSCKDITIKDIITSVDEQIDATQCKGRENCNEGGRCITHNLWASLNNKILTYLDELTLAKLMESQGNKMESNMQNISLEKSNLKFVKSVNLI
jgi:Rrf2 family iron-sulfur cluster assembly transcriptional regulator